MNTPAAQKRSIFERHPKFTLILFTGILILVMDFAAAKLFLVDNSHRIEHPLFSHSLRVNTSATDVWGPLKYDLKTNSLGFKDAVRRKVPFSKSKFRVLLMGDSFTEGIGIPYDYTFAGLLQKSNPDLEILNAGVAGYSPVLYYHKAKYLIEEKKLEIDHLVTFIDISDIQDEIYYMHFEPQEVGKKSLRLKIKEYLKDFGRNKSVIGNRLLELYSAAHRNGPKTNDLPDPSPLSDEELLGEDRYSDNDSWTYDEKVFAKWGEKGVQLARQNMRKLVELCKENDIKLSLAIHPWPVQIKQKDINCKQVQIWQEFAAEHNLKLLNLFPDFIYAEDPDQFFIEGDVHWNEKGHQLVAEKIIRENFIRPSERYSSQ